MRSFKELSKAFKFVPVRSGNPELAGYLHLDGKNSKASLSSKGFHHFDDDENGWFDVEIEDQRGSRILLHNSLTTTQSMGVATANGKAGLYASDIFPNVVVIGTENLRKDRTLSSLSFKFEGAENFFIYDTVEWHSFYNQGSKREVLKAIRKEAWKPKGSAQRKSDVNDVHDIYIVHQPKTYLRIRLEDMEIKVWHSRFQRGHGWAGHEIKITPVISVAFARPITVDDALDRVWRIKGFFDQLALDDLNIKALTFSKFKKGWPAAEVYLPNEANRPNKRRLDVHPLHVPYSRWAERKKFQTVFQNWLAQSQERRFFRAAVRLSLVRLQREIDPTLITLLMAGVESLDELDEPPIISKSTIDKMAAAAHAVAPVVEKSLIRGLLGGLRRTSPKARLRKVCAQSFVSSEFDDFLSVALDFRNRIAHGREMDDAERASAGELAKALTFLAVAYDLSKSGMPEQGDDAHGRRLLAFSRMEWAWQGYKLIQSAKSSPTTS